MARPSSKVRAAAGLRIPLPQGASFAGISFNCREKYVKIINPRLSQTFVILTPSVLA
jgi:hypothetical protein